MSQVGPGVANFFEYLIIGFPDVLRPFYVDVVFRQVDGEILQQAGNVVQMIGFNCASLRVLAPSFAPNVQQSMF